MTTAILLATLILQSTVRPPTALASSPAPSALKATIRFNIAKVPGPSDAPASPLGNLGPLIVQLLTPDGPVEIDYVVAGDATRGELRGRLATFGRGTIVLQRMGDDSIKVLNPANKTWYALPAASTPGALIAAPDVQL